MQVDNEIIVWASERTRALLAGSDLGGYAPVTVYSTEEEVWKRVPPRGNAHLYLIDSDCCQRATPGFIAALAARPSSWPPFVVFGHDLALVKASTINPNSRICESPEGLRGALTAAARYWVLVNEAMTLE